ncbi:MAG: FAD-binding oxidoreductase [Anaerolineae bacterium]|jgi:hypothetical protein|nr:FAD-binding oxidoreductase [Anaerolineae bacterium]
MKVNIVGAGQSGLQLGLGLLKHGYDVTLYSDRTPNQIHDGSVMSTQCMFDNALQTERDLGLNLWDENCPKIDGIMLRIAGPNGEPALNWGACLDKPAQSVDQRLKIPEWMNLFTSLGGELVIKSVGVADLETMTGDLTIVASGKGEIGQLFTRDASRSPYQSPQRILALACLKGVSVTEPFSAVAFNIIPGEGECFFMSGLTTSGPCHFMIMEGIPGGKLDCWGDVTTPEQHLARTMQLLETFLPWEAERCKNAELADQNAVLRGKFAPTVKFPVATLPSGKPVLGMADVVVLNDPITGQGSNNAAKCAAIYLDRIIERGDRSFDAAWMQETFDQYWDYAQWVTGWTNAMLQPPPAHVQVILGAAASVPEVAHRFVNGFNDPRTFFPWLADPAEADKMLSSYQV